MINSVPHISLMVIDRYLLLGVPVSVTDRA